ncbi:MAG: DUF6266 family protein [Bacteroidota bacterium]
MAKMNKGIFGPVLGKVYNLIFSSWKGKNYAKKPANPLPKGKKRSQAPSQKASQNKMRFISPFQSPFRDYINIGFKHASQDKTELNASYSYNYNKAFIVDGTNISVDYSNYTISVGKLPMVKDLQATLSAPDTISLTWKKDTKKGTTYNDQLMMMIYNEEQHMTDGFTGGMNRATENGTFVFNEYLKGHLVHVYFSLTSFDRKQVAESIYWGTLQL